MLEKLRSWAGERLGSLRPDTPEQSRDNARVKREARAQTVTDLQTHVRFLQQQITDLTARVERGGEGTSPEASREKLAELEDQLAQTQAKLTRYQGRI
jgi:predicted  nucleic acid-binding Zn-ribbon protein